jgi:NAD(P)-dependent dehydrogenase (short-subunit alcohol dehydrogenase family)
MTESLAGKVAWVAGVGEGAVGHAIALVLAARGGKVLVTGAAERLLGACVGEIAHAGGTARHLVSTMTTVEDARACVAGAVERFGGLDVGVFVIEKELESVARAFDAAKASMRPGGRLVVVAQAGDPRVSELVREVARVFAPSKLTCNAVLAGAAPKAIRAGEPEDVAAIVAFLCSPAAEAISGATLPVA